jgi:hypothetical protein
MTLKRRPLKKLISTLTQFQELSTVGITEEDCDLDLPMFIPEHDMSLHGLRYYNP